MTDYTQDDFANRVLVELGQQDPDVPVDGEMRSYVADRLTQTLEGLQDDGLVDWDITSDIPGPRFNALLSVMTGVLASAYGVPMQMARSGRPVAEEAGRRMLRGQVLGEYVSPDWERVGDY